MGGGKNLAKHKTKKVPKIKISACYMVRDAEKDLRRSLESLAEYVDEIVVVDTGSVDNTVKVAEEFGAKIIHETWQNDFSTPRNIALREATGDWIVFLDADEYFVNDTAKNLQAAIKLAQRAKQQGLSVHLVNVNADNDNEVINSIRLLRIFEHAPNIRYVGKIHEEVYRDGKPLERAGVPNDMLTVYHTGYSASLSRSKAERNLKLLLEELETTDKPERIYSYIADCYHALKDWANVEKFARLDLENRKNPSNRPARLLIECLEKDPSRAEEYFEVAKLAVERYPKVPEFSAKLADCLAQKGDYRAAVAEMQRAIDKAKNYGQQFESSNFDEEKLKIAQERIDDWKEKIILTPDEKRREVSKLRDELIRCVEVLNDREKALIVAEKLFKLKPDDPEPLERVVAVYIDCAKTEKAEEVVDYMEKNFPPSTYRLMLRSRICHLKGDFLGVIKFCEQALKYDDDINATMLVYNCLGKVYRDIGDAKKSIESYRHNAELDLSPLKNSPQFFQMTKTHREDYQNLLFNLHNTNISREELFEKTRGFNAFLAHIPRLKHNRKKHSAHKKIRVGYVSPDIRFHVVSFFSYHLFMSYDKTRFEVYIYANNPADHITKQFKAAVDEFRDILNMPSKEVAAQIFHDEIDILFDLAGHSANNSLSAFAYKPAPIQISGIGYFDSTGLDTMDYFLADKYTDPEGLNEKFFTEKILRLQHSHFCYKWHDFEHMVAPAPCTKNGYVTFVSFNNFMKVTDEMLKVWAKILDAVPASRLYLKCAAFMEEGGLGLAKERIQAAGIDLDRVILELTEKNYAQKYEQADIALDTFPYPGGGTTCDALFMGVPLITLVGERHNSRFGYSLLMNMGLEELCAFSEEEYIQKAVELANDWDRIREYHLTIRRKMQESPVMNDTVYMGELEQAYEKIFNAWVKGKPLPDFPQEPEPVTKELADEYFERSKKYVAMEDKEDKEKFNRIDFKRALYYAELAERCESKRDAKLYLTIADRRHSLSDNLGAYEVMHKALDCIYSPESTTKNYSQDFISECHKRMARYAHDNGQHVEALENNQRAYELIEKRDLKLQFFDALLLGLHFLDISGKEMAAFHFEYQKFFEDIKPFTTYHKPHARIRVGYISGDFRRHVAFAVVFGFISCHNRSKFEIICYSKNQENDELTEFFKKSADQFIDVKRLSDEELAKKIHDDEIDIAFDLAGHTGYNGLPSLVYHPAPVQICGIGYMSTTGLKEIDYFLTDEILDPPGEHEAHFSEKLLYMPMQFTYAHREDIKPSKGAPCMENGYVTFGTICRYSKINDNSLAIWIEILNLVPNAKLLMRAQEFISNRIVDNLYNKMKSLGCDMDRVIFRPAVPDYFNVIKKLDIILDSYPYVGGVTTLDALFMGVPVINFYGERHSTRFGKSILTSVGLGELSVNSVEDYINRAVALANDFETLDVLHKNLRTMMLNALDPIKYTRCLERKFEEILAVQLMQDS